MTDEEKINRLAIDVMGWHKDWLGYSLYWMDADKNAKALVRDWNPLVSIADAWQVIERMSQLHGWGSMNGFILTHTDNGDWYCEFQKPRWENGEAVIAPRAICLAALRAVGVEVEP